MDRVHSEFEQITARMQHKDAAPYGPAPTRPMSPRAKAGIVVAGAVAATATAVAWQSYTQQQAELELNRQQLAFEQQQYHDNQAAKNAPTAAQKKARVEAVQDCLSKGMPPKDSNVYFDRAGLVDKCNAAFPASTPVNAMPVASESSDSSSGGIGVNGLLIGAAVIGGGVVLAARRKHRA